jgi:HSP20 family protein
MSQVAVERIRDDGTQTHSFFAEVKGISERIRQRAFDLFQRRGHEDGRALNDWVKAESELILTPEADLVEKDGKFEVQIAVPGFGPKDLHVTATSNTLFVNASASTHRHEKDDGNVHFCEFSEKELFRRFDLPTAINVDKVTGDLENGVLHLTAIKQ